jgi:LPS export ABC transporter protein LptC
MSGTKKALITLAVLSVPLALYGLFRWMAWPPGEDLTRRPRPPSLTLEETSLTKLGKDGQKIWTLQAQTIHSTEEVTQAERVEMIFFRNDQETLRVQAQRLTLDPHTDDLALQGRVTAVSREFTLKTEDLQWSAAEEKLWTDAPVILEQMEMTLTGTGFEYSPATGIAQIKKDAHLIWKPKGSRR